MVSFTFFSMISLACLAAAVPVIQKEQRGVDCFPICNAEGRCQMQCPAGMKDKRHTHPDFVDKPGLGKLDNSIDSFPDEFTLVIVPVANADDVESWNDPDKRNIGPDTPPMIVSQIDDGQIQAYPPSTTNPAPVQMVTEAATSVAASAAESVAVVPEVIMTGVSAGTPASLTWVPLSTSLRTVQPEAVTTAAAVTSAAESIAVVPEVVMTGVTAGTPASLAWLPVNTTLRTVNLNAGTEATLLPEAHSLGKRIWVDVPPTWPVFRTFKHKSCPYGRFALERFMRSPEGHMARLRLQNGYLKDETNSFGYIAGNGQMQFDNPPQPDAIYTSGWSITGGGTVLALGDSNIFWACVSSDFVNIYDRNIAPQCSPVFLKIAEFNTDCKYDDSADDK